MPQHESYLLHIWRSRALSGWQWTARVDRLADGERLRFADPEALLAHVHALVHAEPPEHQSAESESPGQGPSMPELPYLETPIAPSGD